MENFINKGKQGLSNIGATCYINTTIQCISYCSYFLLFILNLNNIENDCLINELRNLLIELWINNNSITPRKFIQYLKQNITDIQINQQNDINEFIFLFLEKINKDIAYKLEITKKDLLNNNKYTKSSYDIQRYKMDLSWYNKIKDEYSELINIFYGQSITQIECINCKHLTHNYELYSNLMLSVEESLENSLELYFKNEIMDEWKCDKCKKNTGLKSIKLWRNPKILIISFKRLTYDLKKNDKKIKIPEIFDLSLYTLSKSKYIYKLVSIAQHSGSYDNGHYHAICKHPNDKWYIIDDLSVSEISTNLLDNYISHGYVYFYELI